MNTHSSLARQSVWLLCAAFILIELLVALLFVLLMLLPLARRSADDLAGLMVLSAQTWVELPASKRPAFEETLRQSHALALREQMPLVEREEWHPFYFSILEQALHRRTGVELYLASQALHDETWYWFELPINQQTLAVGLPKARVETQPIVTLLLALWGGVLLAAGLAVWLARRLAQPLAQLEAASALIGQGTHHSLLPETGPRELVSLSRQFNAMAQQVRDLLSARTTLLAGVSHDLRTPLARMCLALELLKINPSVSLIERMERDIQQMNRLIGNVLDLARGLQHEVQVDTDLAEFLTEVAEDFSTLTCQISVVCPAQRHLIPRFALERALGNLLQNALRYAAGAPVELVCVLDAQHCRVGVLDQGAGIAPEQIEAMFQPFYRLEGSRSRATGGSGLGLAIVRELARANGWEVSLSARPGGGLQAWIVMAHSG